MVPPNHHVTRSLLLINIGTPQLRHHQLSATNGTFPLRRLSEVLRLQVVWSCEIAYFCVMYGDGVIIPCRFTANILDTSDYSMDFSWTSGHIRTHWGANDTQTWKKHGVEPWSSSQSLGFRRIYGRLVMDVIWIVQFWWCGAASSKLIWSWAVFIGLSFVSDVGFKQKNLEGQK